MRAFLAWARRPPVRGFGTVRHPMVWMGWLAASACATAPPVDANDLLPLIGRADYAALSRRACDGGALAFAPYARDLVRLELTQLSATALQTFTSSRELYHWGRYDGSGQPIRLTPMAYHRRFVWDIDYGTQARARSLDSGQLRADSGLSAVAQAFPGAEAIVYRYDGTASLGHKDARELILVGRTRPGGWCLLALTHSEDTV